MSRAGLLFGFAWRLRLFSLAENQPARVEMFRPKIAEPSTAHGGWRHMQSSQMKQSVPVVFKRLGGTYRERDTDLCSDELPVDMVMRLLHLDRTERERSKPAGKRPRKRG